MLADGCDVPVWTTHLSSPERGVKLATQLVQAVVDRCLKHTILQEGDESSWGANLPTTVIEGDLHICMLLLFVHKGTQPGCGMRGQPIPAFTSPTCCAPATTGIFVPFDKR